MIATTREQSERLIKCGVPSETGDMFRSATNNLGVGNYYQAYSFPDIPAWSLSKLFELLPKIIESLEEDLPDCLKDVEYGFMIKYSAEDVKVGYYDCYGMALFDVDGKDVIELCVQTIEWLLTNGYKLNNSEE